MKYLLVFSVFLAQCSNILAQSSVSSVAGEYHLTGVRETASGFKLNEDGKFQFFNSYGAVDQYGEGKWKLEGNNVVLNSSSYPDKDFRLETSKQVKDKSVTVKINDANSMVLRYIICTLQTNNGIEDQQTDANGSARFKKGTVKKISLLHKFWPQRTSEFEINSEDNYFEFTILSTIAQVYFDNFKLSIDGKDLKGKHPLLEGLEYNYIKE